MSSKKDYNKLSFKVNSNIVNIKNLCFCNCHKWLPTENAIGADDFKTENLPIITMFSTVIILKLG